MKAINCIAREMVTALRDALPDDPVLRDHEIRDFARRHRCHAADVVRALADLPAPVADSKLPREQRDARDLARLRDARDDAGRRGYPVTFDKLCTHERIVETELAKRARLRDARAILDGWDTAVETRDGRRWVRSGDNLVALDAHLSALQDATAAEALSACDAALSAIRETRSALAGRRATVTVTDSAGPPLRDGETLRVPAPAAA